MENTKANIKELSTPNESQHEQWDIDTMITWIGGLEDGKYKKYLERLKNGFIKSEIRTGEYLSYLDASRLSDEPFGIQSQSDRVGLEKAFKRLQKQTR